MQKWNFKHVLMYTAMIISVVAATLLTSAVTETDFFILIYQKLTFAIPVIFIIAAFLSFRISETRIVLISLAFLVLSLSRPLSQFLSTAQIPVLNFMDFEQLLSPERESELSIRLASILPISLSLVFLVPERIGRIPMTFLKVVLTAAPFLLVRLSGYEDFFIIEYLRYGSFRLPWPGIAAAFLPLSGPFFYRDRRTGPLSSALTSALVLLLLPVLMPLRSFQNDACFLFVGIILLHALYRVYWENSYKDELTGLFNRRALDERLRKLRRGYALAMVDVDHFKKFNDTYGHDAGDNVLRLVAKILNTHFGNSAFRYGGEEFCVIFKKNGADSAFEMMDEARAAIEEHMFYIRRNVKNRKRSGRKKAGGRAEKVRLTVSAGLAVPGKSRRDGTAVLKDADKALYAAKENGRNRVEVSRSEN